MQMLLPWLVMMAAAPQELVATSAHSLSATAKDVTRVNGAGGDWLLITYAGQQFPWLDDRSKSQQGTQHLQDFPSAGPKHAAPPQFKCRRDSQERVVCYQEAVDVEHTHRQQTLQQEPVVHPREEEVYQERYHNRAVRQVDEYQDGHQRDQYSAGAEQVQPQSNGAENEAQPQSNGAQNEAQPQSNGSHQTHPQSDGAQQSQPQSDGAQQSLPQSAGTQAESPLCSDSRCHCEAVAWAVNADCSHSGLDHLPAGLHPNTTRLTLSGNNLHQIGNDSVAHLDRVMSLYLGNNSISDVHADAFSVLWNLRVVDLSSNRLSALPHTVFRSSGKLQKLDLSWNPLRLAGGPLVDSASLYWLNLSHCGLSSLPEDTFKGVPQMVMLDLSENQLAVPTALALETLTGLRRLPLLGNPVSCCEVSELRTWVERRQVSVTRRHLQFGPLPACAAPDILRGRPWTAASSAVCSPSLDVAAAVGCALLGLVVLSLLVATTLLLLRRSRRARRRRRSHSARRRQESQTVSGQYEPPPVVPSPAKHPQLVWEGHCPSGPRYVASFKAAQPPPQRIYDDAIGAGRDPRAPARHCDAPASPTYDDAVGGGRTSPQYDYILGPVERPPHHASIPSVLEGCDYYEDA